MSESGKRVLASPAGRILGSVFVLGLGDLMNLNLVIFWRNSNISFLGPTEPSVPDRLLRLFGEHLIILHFGHVPSLLLLFLASSTPRPKCPPPTGSSPPSTTSASAQLRMLYRSFTASPETPSLSYPVDSIPTSAGKFAPETSTSGRTAAPLPPKPQASTWSGGAFMPS